MFITSEVVGIASLCLVYAVMISQSGNVSLPLMMHFSVGFGYTLSTFAFSLSTGLWSPAEISEFPAMPIFTSADSVSYALALILFVQAACTLASLVFRPINTKDWGSQLYSPGGKWFVVALCAFLAFAFASGDLGYMGVQISSESGASPIGIIGISILPAVAASTVLFAVSERRYFWIIVAIAMVIATALTGRRFLLFTLLMIPILSAICNRPVRIATIIRMLPVLAVFGVGAYFLSLFFVAVRIAQWSLVTEASTLDLLVKAVDLYSADQGFAVQDFIQRTTASRTLVLYYLAGMVDAFINGYLPLYGKDAYQSLLTAIPSAFWPDKLLFVFGASEEFVHPIVGFPIFDGPNSIVVSGFTDFGPIGAIVYPLLKVWVFGLLISLSGRVGITKLAPIFSTLIAIVSITYIEQSLTGDFTTIRNIIMFIIAMNLSFIVLRLLPKRKLKNH